MDDYNGSFPTRGSRPRSFKLLHESRIVFSDVFCTAASHSRHSASGERTGSTFLLPAFTKRWES